MGSKNKINVNSHIKSPRIQIWVNQSIITVCNGAAGTIVFFELVKMLCTKTIFFLHRDSN